MTWKPYITFFVPGIPRPGGSKTATVIRRKGGEIVMKNGRPLVSMRDDAKGNADWKQTVAVFATAAARKIGLHQLPMGPLRLEIRFVMPRRKGDYGTGRNAGVLKASAAVFHTSKPDCTKLIRSTEDALTGIVWRDDAEIAVQSAEKPYGEKPGALIRVSTLEGA